MTTIAAIRISVFATSVAAYSVTSAIELQHDREKGPGTLFAWNYGTNADGGPDLDAPLVSDRPDFTESSVTVGRGVVQLESGYTFATDGDGNARLTTHSYPELLLRCGVLSDWLELRVGQNFASEVDQSIRRSGAENVYTGVKLAVTPQDGILPEMALVPQMTVPTGHDDLSGREVLPGVNWLYGWDVNDALSFGGSTQVNRAIEGVGDETYAEWAQSCTLGYSLLDRVGAYAEWFAFFPHAAQAVKPEYYLNGGLTWRINNDIQADVRAGMGLNEAAADLFAGAGLVLRWR